MNETEISWTGSPAKHGNYFIFTIPNKLIKKGIIDPDATFQILLKPMKKMRLKKKKKREIQEINALNKTDDIKTETEA